MKTPRQTPTEGPCMYCDVVTTEGRFWADPIEEVQMPGTWVYAHENCKGLSHLRMEDMARRRLREDPGDPGLKLMLQIMSKCADTACAKVLDKQDEEKTTEMD